MPKKIVFIAVIIFLAACSPYKLTKISVLIPGKIAFPPDVRNVSLAMMKNEFNTPAGKLDFIDNIKLYPGFNYHKLTKDYLFGMRSILEESPKFDKVIISNQHNFDSIGINPDYNWNEIIRICRNDSTDALIIIDGFYLLDSLFINPYDDGCTAAYQLINHLSYIVLYPKMLQIAGEFSFSNTISSSEYGDDCTGALNELPDGGDMIVQSCYETGQKAVESSAPYWFDNINRVYYSGGNKIMRKGAFFAKRNMWLEAAEYWRMAVESDKKNIAAKAALNMALVCEIEDKLDIAGDWAKMSDSIKSTSVSKQYKEIILLRTEQRKILDEQMNIE